jgi:hypothetical protein
MRGRDGGRIVLLNTPYLVILAAKRAETVITQEATAEVLGQMKTLKQKQ